MEAAGLSRVAVAVRILEDAVKTLGISSEVGKDVVKAVHALLKHIPEGSVPSGVQQSTLEALMQRNQQMSPQIAAVRAMQPPGGGAGGAGGGMSPPAQ